MKLTPRKALTSLLARFERHEYRRFIAQDETEGTGTYYWRLKEDKDTGYAPYIDDEEFQEMLALVVPTAKRKRKKAKK